MHPSFIIAWSQKRIAEVSLSEGKNDVTFQRQIEMLLACLQSALTAPPLCSVRVIEGW